MSFRKIYLHTVNGNTYIRINGNGCKWARYDLNGNFDSHGQDFITRPSEDELNKWKDEAKIFAGKLEKNKNNLNQKFYIRFNRLPKNGISKNYATGEYELGVSCYAAEFDVMTETFRFLEDGTDIGAAIAYVFSRSKVYLLTGDEVGRGSDGEPVLANVKKVCELKYDVELDGYVKIKKTKGVK